MLLFLPLITAGAIWLALRLRHPRDRPVRESDHRARCPRCMYSLTGLPADVGCPECGLGAGERVSWEARNAARRAAARLATTLCAVAACLGSMLGFAVGLRLDVAGLIAVAVLVPWPFVLAAVLAGRCWRRPWAAFGVGLSGSLVALMCSIGMSAVLFSSRDPLDALVLVWFPFLGSGAAALGILFGAVCAYLSARGEEAKSAADA